jgi:hypothetical protein
MMELLLVLAGIPAAAPAAVPAKLAVTNVVAEKRAFRPEAGEKAVWRFRASASSELNAAIFDARGVLVRELPTSSLDASDHRVAWDGDDDQNRHAPAGYYLLVIQARNGDQTEVYDPTDSTGGDAVTASAVGYDASKYLVRYALTRPALVRIHLGLTNGGPLLKTLVDWVARAPGEHTEPWDGWDASRAIQLGASQNLDIQVWGYELPVNAVVLERSSGEPRMKYLEFPEGRPVRARAAQAPHEMYNHWRHDRTRCHNLEASLSIADGARRVENGAALFDGPLPIRLDLPPDDAAFLQEERFEVVVYLDGLFVFEEEQGYLPFSWTAKSDVIPPGDHVVTMMIRGYEGHFGSASIRVHRPGVESQHKSGSRKRE